MPKDLKRKVALPRAEPKFDEQLLHQELINGDDDKESDCGKLRPVLMDDNRYALSGLGLFTVKVRHKIKFRMK
jgi:hypothetical protein